MFILCVLQAMWPYTCILYIHGYSLALFKHAVIIVSDKLKSEGRANKTLIYSETAGSMEKLAVLRAWAEVYIEAVSHELRSKELEKHGSSSGGAGRDTESLLDLVKPELRELARLWIAILRDHALLSLSSGGCNCHCM